MFFQIRQTNFILKYPFNFTGIGPKKCVLDVFQQVYVGKTVWILILVVFVQKTFFEPFFCL